ncbi:MAG: DUF998 domain-containing protein [Chloroflexi bacterium]|nr:MAG: DUF998 domain-containing protein [Chloroflexota bacterium]
MIPRRFAAMAGLLVAPVALGIVVVAGVVTPGYDPMTRTISRLAVPGMPAAGAVDWAIALIALACFGLAVAVEPREIIGRAALALAGVAFVCAAAIHLDPGSASATAAHRVASGVAVLGLTAAPLALGRTYGRMSLILGTAELGVLGVGLVLLTTSFAAWGAWERCLLALALAWIVLVALTIVSNEDTSRATSAAISSGGSRSPTSSVTSANR